MRAEAGLRSRQWAVSRSIWSSGTPTRDQGGTLAP
jgi:hypothetical protein